VPNYLVVDLEADVLLNYCNPVNGEYPEPEILRHDGVFSLAGAQNIRLASAEFLFPT
jgi:hypothetical protein